MANQKVVWKKKVGNGYDNVYPKTSADQIIMPDEETNLQGKLEEIDGNIQTANQQLADIAKLKLEQDIIGTTYKKDQKVDLEYVRKQQIFLYANLFKKLRSNQSVRIDTAGDSLTYGLDTVSADKRAASTATDDLGRSFLSTDTRGSKTYPEALQEKLRVVYPSITVVNRGWSGDSVKDGFTRWINKTGADVTVIDYGINDALSYSNIAGDLEQYLYWYEQFIVRLILQGSAVIIMRPTKNITDDTDLKRTMIDVFSRSLSLFGEKYNIPIVDGDELLRNYDKSIIVDNVHLNGYGYNILGAKLAAIFLGSGIETIQRVTDGSKILSRPAKDDLHYLNGATYSLSGGAPTPSEIDTVNANGMAISMPQNSEVIFTFYSEVDDLVILPYMRINGVGPANIEFRLDFGIDQALHSLSSAINLTDRTAKRSPSVVPFTSTKTWKHIDKNSYLTTGENIEIRIATKGWHTLRVTNKTAGNIDLFGLEFLNYDTLRNLKITNSLDIRASYYDSGKLPSGTVTETRIPFSALKEKLNWDYYNTLDTASTDTPLKITISNTYVSILTYYILLGSYQGDGKFVPTTPTIRQNISANPSGVERVLSSVQFDNTTKDLVLTWGGKTDAASKFTIAVA